MKGLKCFILAIVLIMLFPSCKSSDVVEVDRYVMPTLVFPDFPILDSATDNGDTVTISKEFFLSLAEYKIKIEQTQADYKDLCEIYGTHKRE